MVRGSYRKNIKIDTLARNSRKDLYIRRNYYRGPLRISWYLDRYHGIQVSDDGVRNVFKRHNLNRLPRN